MRAALEARLDKVASREGLDVQRLRRQVAFDRLLCRLFVSPHAPWLLKGGYAMELRVKAARTTRDIDLGLKGLPTNAAGWEANAGPILESLREAARGDLQDYFEFLIAEATQDLAAAPYGGARYPVDARLGGRTFVKFHLDVSAGDVLQEPYDMLQGADWLGFADIPAGTFRAISAEEQFAEKLHAYTLPRTGRGNTRVKDLIDLILLIERLHLDAARVGRAVRETFQRRRTHEIPAAVLPPPESWSATFEGLARECGIEADLQKQFGVVARFYAQLRR